MNSTTDNAALLLWKWQISPKDPSTTTCPSASAILGTFAVVNVVTSLLGVLTGHRLVLKKISFGFFGKKDSTSWKYMWMVTLALQLGANSLIAAIIKNTPGYNSTFQVGELVLFFTARPRLSWIALASLWMVRRQRKTSDEIDLPWASAACTQLIAEFVLLLMGLVVMGRTAHFAASNGYLKLGPIYSSLPHWAHVMYSGALYYVVAGIGFGIMQMITLSTWFKYRDTRREKKKDGFLSRFSILGPIFLFASLLSFWMASWLFWAGFVYLAGDL
jgi:hypothetical protein